MKLFIGKHLWKTLILVLLVVMVLFTSSCGRGKPESDVSRARVNIEDVAIKLIWVGPTYPHMSDTMPGSMYVFKLNAKGTLYAGLGTAFMVSSDETFGDDFADLKPDRIVEDGSIQLSDEQFDKIEEMVNGIKPLEEFSTYELNSMRASDNALDVIMTVNGTKIKFAFGVSAAIEKKLDELVAQFIDYSPVQIVDGLGNPIKLEDYRHPIDNVPIG